MTQNLDNLSPNSRIWIYQADRILSEEEKEIISKKASAFLQQWAAHGNDLLASSGVFYNHFLVISTDESFNMASGCSIDSQFRFVQDLGRELNIDFFNRTNLAFLKNGTVHLVPLNKLKEEVASENISSETPFFDNNINTKRELVTIWPQKADETWLKRYFQVEKSV